MPFLESQLLLSLSHMLRAAWPQAGRPVAVETTVFSLGEVSNTFCNQNTALTPLYVITR